MSFASRFEGGLVAEFEISIVDMKLINNISLMLMVALANAALARSPAAPKVADITVTREAH